MKGTRMIFNEDTYTADTSLKNLTQGKYIHDLIISLQGEATAATAVEGEDLLTLLNRIDVMKNGSPIVQVRGFDLLALNALLGIGRPWMYDSSAATDDEAKLMGLKIPLSLPAGTIGDYTVKFDYAALSGCDTTKLSVAEVTSDTELETGYFHMVEIPIVTASATGYGNTIDLPQPGELIGILFYNNDPPQAGNEDSTIQELRVKVDGVQQMETSWDLMKQDFDLAITDAQVSSIAIRDSYALLDLRNDPISKDKEVKIDINSGVASQSIRVIPIYRIR